MCHDAKPGLKALCGLGVHNSLIYFVLLVRQRCNQGRHGGAKQRRVQEAADKKMARLQKQVMAAK